MKKVVCLIIIVLTLESFAGKNMTDIVFRKGGLTLIPNVEAGHCAIYVSSQDYPIEFQRVYEYMPKCETVYTTQGNDGGLFYIPFTVFKNYDGYMYLGAKSRSEIDPYRATAVTNVIQLMETVFDESEYGSVYKLLPAANGEDNNSDGFNETFNCVTFTEFVYANCMGLNPDTGTGLGGFDATPLSSQIGAGYPLTAQDQYESVYLSRTEEGDPSVSAINLTAINKGNRLTWQIENDAELYKIQGFNIYANQPSPANKLNPSLIRNGIKKYQEFRLSEPDCNNPYLLEVVYRDGSSEILPFER